MKDSTMHYIRQFAARFFPAALFFTFCISAAAEDNEPADVDIYNPVILEIDPDNAQEAIYELVSNGAVVLRQRDELVLCCLPIDYESRIKKSRSKRFKKIESRPRNVLTMKNVRQWYDGYKLATGEGLLQPYDGTGVVVGFCDTGFDPNHVNFRSADGSSLRVKRVVHYDETFAKRTVLETEEEIKAWSTDNTSETHATHVCGIMAGAYARDGYQGMAPGAEIVATTSELSDVGLLAGVEDIIEYASSQGKPCVVNLSVGNYVGPHDGSSLFCRYLDKCGDDAIICISSGNEGNKVNTISMPFTDDKTTSSFMLESRVGYGNDIAGYIDIWMDDDTPCTVQMACYNTNSNVVVADFDTIDFSKTPEVIIASTEYGNDVYSEEMAKYFQGSIKMTGEVDSSNNRFHIQIYPSVVSETPVSSTQPWPLYILGGHISSASGAHATLYADGQTLTFDRIRRGNEPAPSADNSVSDLATGHNVICVGLYSNSEPVTMFDGSTFRADSDPGCPSGYSGYATLVDGRVLPHTLGPGIPVVSSYSGPYLAAAPEKAAKTVLYADGSYDFLADQQPDPQSDNGDLAEPEYDPVIPEYASGTASDDSGESASSTYDSSMYYWGPDGGTSMSTPYVAGTIACWLQANPDLKVADVKGVIESTNDRSGNAAYSVDPRNGEGWFNPYQGMVEVSRNTTGISAPDAPLDVRIVLNNRNLQIYNPAGARVEYQITNLNGLTVSRGAISDYFNRVNLQDSPSGLYLVRFNSAGHTKTAKVIL